MLVSARSAESVARREREDEERLVAHDDDDDDLDEDEVTTDVFEVDISGGSSPWATTFLECASEGDLATVTKLLEEGKVDLNDVDVDGFTALMIAAAEAQTDVAMYLLEKGADVSIRTHEMRSTALHFAAKSGEARVVEAICKQDRERVDAQNLDGDTPLVWACTEGRAGAVRVLLAYNANVNVVSHRAMSVLICAVMLRGVDANEDEGGSESDSDEKGIASDGDRAEIVRMLLEKNPKLVNYQDRDGSTAMHLAASHGYIKCVKALLDFGADITLRNAIGQTAIEEAEETGVGPKSDLCVQYLRLIWKKLEEEAAARMMAMLEMEDAASASNAAGGKSTKKSAKKKAKKAKQRRGSKTTTSAPTSVSATEKTEDKDEKSSVEGSSDDDEDGQPEKVLDKADHGAITDAPGVVPASADSNMEEDDASAHDGGVWTTVGRKHQQYLAQRAAEASSDGHDSKPTPDTKPTPDNASTKPTQKLDDQLPAQPPRRTRPVTPPQRGQTHPSSRQAGSVSVSTASKVTPRSQPEPSSGSPTKIVPASPRLPKQQERDQSVQKPRSQPSSSSAASVPGIASAQPPVGSPFSTFQSLHHTSRLYERYETGDRSRMAPPAPSLVSSMWRGSSSTPNRTSTVDAVAFSLTTTASAATPSPSAIWRYSSPSVQAINHTPRRWTVASERSPEDELRRFLECGICGELVNDNRQCTTAHSMQCLQLYCVNCLVRSTAPNSTMQCVKCRQPVDVRAMQRNDLAQAEAAALALATQRHHHQITALDEMKRLLSQTTDKIQVLDLDPVSLVPGANLSNLSVGQLDALEELHLVALQQITHARLENARAMERLKIEEYLKTQRDLFQFAPQR